jgi:hypothetical protein
MTHDCNAYCVFKSWVSEIRGGEPNIPELGIDDAYESIVGEAIGPYRPLIEAARAYRDAHERAKSRLVVGEWARAWLALDDARTMLLEAAHTFGVHVEEDAKK